MNGSADPLLGNRIQALGTGKVRIMNDRFEAVGREQTDGVGRDATTFKSGSQSSSETN